MKNKFHDYWWPVGWLVMWVEQVMWLNYREPTAIADKTLAEAWRGE